MPETAATVQFRVPAEGADPLLLAGVNDANLLALTRATTARATLRGDHLLLAGTVDEVERALPLARRLVDLARAGDRISADDVERMAEEFGAGRGLDGDEAGRDGTRNVVVPGARKSIAAKTEGQRRYLQAIEDNDVVVGIGPAGTGKTYLAVAMAVDALARKRVKRIVLARPAVEAGESLGFLPGDLQEKVDPYLRPLYDALEDMMPLDRMRRALDTRTIEVAPLAFMRGRTLQDAFVILDEAQNTTAAQMKMFLTRLGVNSKAVITGDKTQIDLPRREESGLVQIERLLRGIDSIEFVYMEATDVVRHRLVRDILRAYEQADLEKQE